jgi:hypothetical protein
MKLLRSVVMASLALVMMLVLVPAHAASKTNENGQGKAVVTILPQKGSQTLAPVPVDELYLKVDGRESRVTGWTPLGDAAHRIEVVVLIDDGSQHSLGTQLPYIQSFIQQLPAGSAVAIAYMGNGRALLATPMSTDHAAVSRRLRLPAGGSAGISASPYFCLSDLVKNWPSKDEQARREVVMITSGVDYYADGYNPDDPYVQAAIADALRNHVIVDSIYWSSRGRSDANSVVSTGGESLLAQVADATGGSTYWMGFDNPVSIEPYFTEIVLRMAHQYQLEYVTELKGRPGVESMKLQVKHTAGKVTAPRQTYVQQRAESK